MRRLSTLKTRDRLPVMGGVIGRDDAVTDFYDEFSGWRKTPWKGICYVSSKTRDITFTIKDNVIRMHPFNMTLMTNYMSNDDYDTLRYTKEVTVDKTMKHMCLQLIAMTSLATIRNKK